MYRIVTGDRAIYKLTPYDVFETLAYDLAIDYEQSIEVQGFCELAGVGEVYELDTEFYIEIV